MISQTITLIRYFLTAYSNRKNLYMLLIILIIGVVLSQFVAELSLSQAEQASLALQIEFYRFALILFSVLMLIVSVADDYESRQFEMLLSMPLHRWQYIAAQIGTMALVNLFLCVLGALTMIFESSFYVVAYWLLSFWLELMLVSIIALLAVISLEKVPPAVMLTISLYVLSRSSDSILQIISMSVEYSDQSIINVLLLNAFQWVQYILPSTEAFLSNDVFLSVSEQPIQALYTQLFSASVYIMFIVAVILFDFYRKDFALKQ